MAKYEIVICDECGKKIEGRYLTTLGKHFCNEKCVNKWMEDRKE